MSMLEELREKHKREILKLQSCCLHPDSSSMSVNEAEGVWGVAEFCKVCGKQLYWIEEPERTHEVEYIPVEWIR